MIESRKFRRFESPVGVKFRPTYGAIEYATGDAMNLSRDGLALDAHDFKFFQYENLELIMDAPDNGDRVSVCGYIVWKKQMGKRCLAGVKFRMQDEHAQKEAVDKIFSYLNIPADRIYDNTPDREYGDHAEIISPARSGVQINTSPGLPKKLGFVKQYHENGAKCKVTFRLLREMAENSRKVTITGEFNDWDVSGPEMRRVENGDFVITLDLESNREYRFRYLIDGSRWENDWYADRYVLNAFGSKDSVVIV